MNTKYFLNKFGGLVFVILLLTGITMLSTTSAEAQRRYYRPVIVRPYYYSPYRPFGWNRGWNGYGWYNDPWVNSYNQYVFDNSEKAAEVGYKNGFSTGKDDGKKSKSYSPERSHYYHDAGFGNYAEVYRRNFSRGYNDGYHGGMEAS